MSAGDPKLTDPSVAFGILTQEAAKFRAWAGPDADKVGNGEWQTDYEDWGYAHIAIEDALKAAPLPLWPPAVIDDLLYLLAHDNECEETVDLIAKHPEALLWIAEVACDRGEPDARWQIADRLGNSRSELERRTALLQRYMKDSDKYVRVRAQSAVDRLNGEDDNGPGRTES